MKRRSSILLISFTFLFTLLYGLNPCTQMGNDTIWIGNSGAMKMTWAAINESAQMEDCSSKYSLNLLMSWDFQSKSLNLTGDNFSDSGISYYFQQFAVQMVGDFLYWTKWTERDKLGALKGKALKSLKFEPIATNLTYFKNCKLLETDLTLGFYDDVMAFQCVVATLSVMTYARAHEDGYCQLLLRQGYYDFFDHIYTFTNTFDFNLENPDPRMIETLMPLMYSPVVTKLFDKNIAEDEILSTLEYFELHFIDRIFFLSMKMLED